MRGKRVCTCIGTWQLIIRVFERNEEYHILEFCMHFHWISVLLNRLGVHIKHKCIECFFDIWSCKRYCITIHAYNECHLNLFLEKKLICLMNETLRMNSTTRKNRFVRKLATQDRKRTRDQNRWEFCVRRKHSDGAIRVWNTQ